MYDFWQLTDDAAAEKLWKEGVRTLTNNMHRFDSGYWSMYDEAPLAMKNIASSFYHKLHIVQLEVMFKLTGHETFKEYAEKFKKYELSAYKKHRALIEKICFKLLYY